VNSVYYHKGIAHEVTDASNYNGSGWVTIRCGSPISPFVGVHTMRNDEPVTCLLCLGHVEKETDAQDEEASRDDGDGWSCGGGGGLGG
jgi:hypothetical protein